MAESSADFTPVPSVLLDATLSAIDTVNELKVTLRACRLLYVCRDRPPRVRRQQLLSDDCLRRGLRVAGSAAMTERNILEGLALAVDRGTLLHIKVSHEGGSDEWYLLNTEHARRYVEQVISGAVDARREGLIAPCVAEPQVELSRPTLYALYEQNIGLMSPLVAEELAEMEDAYPSEWIAEAFREAVMYNRRSLRYVQRILENWAREGRDGGPADRRRRVKERRSQYEADR